MQNSTFFGPADIIISQVIIWGNSTTWHHLNAELWTPAHTIVISTSRDATAMKTQKEIIFEVWLDLWDRKSIESIASWVAWQVDMLSCEKITLHLHAMSMSGIDMNYPENLVKEIRKYSNALLNIIYISYEQAADENHPQGSHVNYPARTTKDAVESSLQSLKDANAIVDLIVFDSPSAKVLWPTFVGVVWDFVDFFKKRFWEEKLHSFFPEAIFKEGFRNVSAFLQMYPLRWEVEAHQKSMKQMAATGEFQKVINTQTKLINFGHLSFMSWDISDLYLSLAMRYIKENEDAIVWSGKRLLLTWDKITENMDDTELLKAIQVTQDKILSRTRGEGIWKDHQVRKFETPTSIFLRSKEETFILNPRKINVLNEHMWIFPMMVQHELALQEAAQDDEDIISIRCPSQMYAGDELRITRNGNTVTISNAKNPREIFTEVQVWKRSEMKIPKREKWVKINPQMLENEQTVEQMTPETPHRSSWIRQFLNGIPKKIEGTDLDVTSAVLENVWFKIWALIKTQGNFLASHFWVKEEDLKKLVWMFGTIKATYLRTDFEEHIKNKDFDLEIWEFKIREIRGEKTLIVKVNLIHNDEIIWSYSIIGK